jgi:hypothetical protein
MVEFWSSDHHWHRKPSIVEHMLVSTAWSTLTPQVDVSILRSPLTMPKYLIWVKQYYHSRVLGLEKEHKTHPLPTHCIAMFKTSNRRVYVMYKNISIFITDAHLSTILLGTELLLQF